MTSEAILHFFPTFIQFDPVVLVALWNNCLYAVISVVFQVF
ncbi:hypothetical protein [Mesorhizobium sp.]|nr:hypothetical protein [Mesorhizobium sp.]